MTHRTTQNNHVNKMQIWHRSLYKCIHAFDLCVRTSFRVAYQEFSFVLLTVITNLIDQFGSLHCYLVTAAAWFLEKKRHKRKNWIMDVGIWLRRNSKLVGSLDHRQRQIVYIVIFLSIVFVEIILKFLWETNTKNEWHNPQMRFAKSKRLKTKNARPMLRPQLSSTWGGICIDKRLEASRPEA